MPLDSTSIDAVPLDTITLRWEHSAQVIPAPVSKDDALLAAGITPVSADKIAIHKRGQEVSYRRTFGIPPTQSIPGWESRRVLYATTLLRKALLNLPLVQSIDTKDASRPPERLIKLAEKVDKIVEHPEYHVEFFADDPILHVTYGPFTDRRTACLGIWDKGAVVHIAKQRGWLSRLINKL